MGNSGVTQVLVSKKKENSHYKLMLKAKHQMAKNHVKTKYIQDLVSKKSVM